MEPTLTQNCALYSRSIKLQKAVRRFSRSFALRPTSGGRMFGGSRPLATYSS